jgi:hypothetical protein
LRFLALLFLVPAFFWSHSNAEEIHLGQGMMSGEVTDSPVLPQTRLTRATELDANEDLPGAPRVAKFEWRESEGFHDVALTPLTEAVADRDFIARHD